MDFRDGLYNHWGWVLVVSSFIITIPLHGIEYSYNSLMVWFQDEFQASKSETGLAGTIAIGLLSLSSPLSFFLLEFVSTRTVILLGVAMCSTGLFASSFVPSLPYLYFTYGVLYGIGSNFTHVPALALIIKYFPKKHTVSSTCIAQLGASIGVIALPSIVETLFGQLGWRMSMRIFAGVMLLTGTLGIVFVPPTVVEERRQSKAMEALKDCEKSKEAMLEKQGLELIQLDLPQKSFVRRYIDFMSQMKFWVTELLFFVMALGVTMSLTNIGSFLSETSLSEDKQVLVLSVMGIGDLVARVFVSAAVERLPFSRTTYFSIACLIAGVPFFFLVVASDSVVLLISLLLLINFGRGSLFGMIVSVGVEVFGAENSDESTTSVFFAFGLGGLFAAPVGGAISDATGSYVATFYFCGSLCILAFIIATVLAKMRRNAKSKLYEGSTESPIVYTFPGISSGPEVYETYITTV
ncbi:monocarboxylate transporter 12-like [Anneissia japonica]|uniref:monocarboxylate transporter 12-like n=1 Tax=Anneissia japonica TaxID=1529436 RepID=UPI00142593EA|nr:monocarboxylate transporter 12-like [Anneissia japonica]